MRCIRARSGAFRCNRTRAGRGLSVWHVVVHASCFCHFVMRSLAFLPWASVTHSCLMSPLARAPDQIISDRIREWPQPMSNPLSALIWSYLVRVTAGRSPEVRLLARYYACILADVVDAVQQAPLQSAQRQAINVSHDFRWRCQERQSYSQRAVIEVGSFVVSEAQLSRMINRRTGQWSLVALFHSSHMSGHWKHGAEYASFNANHAATGCALVAKNLLSSC